ncbi:MAG: class I SAM-dependent methyltransferase [Aestuariibacter sp.]
MKATKMLVSVLAVCSTVVSLTASAGHHEQKDMAFDHSHRSEKNQQRDMYRQPFRTLNFFGVEENHKVVEIMPGGGWYTEILAPMLMEKGQLIAAHYPADSEGYRGRSRKGFEEKLAEMPKLYGKTKIVDFVPAQATAEEAKYADVVLTFRGLHGLQNGGELNDAFQRFNEMLKTGGKLGVVQHQAPEGHDPVATAKKGYLPKSYVIEVAQKAGFKLVAEAYFHNNPKDTIIQDNHKIGVWALPPSLRDEENQEKYKKIGESNRMTLLFEKM